MLSHAATFVARHQHIAALINDAFAAASPEMLTRPAGPGRWSAREVVIHLGNCAEACLADMNAQLTGEPLKREYLPADEWNAREQARFAHLDGSGALRYYNEMRERLDAMADRLTDEHGTSLEMLLMTVEHEASHLHQLWEALAADRGDVAAALLHQLEYARSLVLSMLCLEFRPAAALLWHPPTGKWSAAEHLIHLSVGDRYMAAMLAAMADGRPEPPEPWAGDGGGMDEWNEAQVAARRWLSLDAILHELGAARGDLTAQVRRLSPEQVAAVAEDLRSHAKHDRHHVSGIWRALREWLNAQHG